MKYLKKYKLFENNSLSELEDEINKLCDTGLVSIKDDGYSYYVTTVDDDVLIEISSVDDESSIPWPDIRDELVPFLEIINDIYDIDYVMFNYDEFNSLDANVDEILRDNLEINHSYESIQIFIKGRK